MTSLKRTLSSIGILAGATVGAGVFTLPYAASRSGLLLFCVYLVALVVFVIVAHWLYWRVLEQTGDTTRLVGLSRKHLGLAMERLAFLSIILGLIFTLSIYILLGGRFLARVFPISPDLAQIAFWIVVSIPLAFNLRRFVRIELFITTLMAAAVFAVIFTQSLSPSSLPLYTGIDFFFPFGPLLFALTGWTALEPMVRRYRQSSATQLRPIKLLIIGTVAIAVLYLLFVIGIAGVSTQVTADTFTGLGLVPPWYLFLLFMFGICALITSYLPMSLEIKNALVTDLKWPPSLIMPVILFLPYIIILAGLNNFTLLIELVGGVFLAFQYLIIILVACKVLKPRGWRFIALKSLLVVVVLAIVYQFYYLLV